MIHLKFRARKSNGPLKAGYLALFFLGAAIAFASGASAAEKPLLDLSKAPSGKQVVATPPDEVAFALSSGVPGLTVACKPGKNEYPGVEIHPATSVWDLSANGYVEAKVTNTGQTPITVCLRVDCEGDWTTNPWNAENSAAKPGETVTVRVLFGYSWGKRGFALKPAKVNAVHVFIGKAQSEQSFRIETLVAGGVPGMKPAVNPEDVREKPANGVLLGAGAKADSPLTVESNGAAGALERSVSNQTLRLTFPDSGSDSSVALKCGVGRWDLRDWLQVVVRAKNTGASAATLKARLDSGSGACPWVSMPKPIAPGETGELTLPFSGGPITLNIAGSIAGESPFESDRASAVRFASSGAATFVIDSIKATTPPSPALPEWLGKRPPVPGPWKQTLDEEFSGSVLNEAVWTVYHPNYWDKKAHFSKNNVILKNGTLTLRFEKKRGHENDDASLPETDYATGFITSTHKWTQKYGYFESRMKLPRAPGMWPAFWMMPDRGPSAGAAREDTRDGGMEIDILEYLARYGAYRYNVACHWDGYDKDHKSTGTDHIYIQPDKDGFFTAGVLWEPGKLTFYCNGKEIAHMSGDRVISVPAYILFTAVSGGWGGNEVTDEGLPSDLVIDYVRAWQRQ